MKKLIIILVATVALIGCKKSEEIIHFDQTASQGIAGTYVGTWTRSLNADSVSGEGTITFVANDTLANVATITATCTNIDPAINRTGIVNVAHSDYEYIFYNNSTADEAGFGAKFSGRVYKDGSIDMQYTVEEKVNKKRYTYNFSFKGNKQNTPN